MLSLILLEKIFLANLKCWFANISVGAIKATWYPDSITFKAVSNATTVLPEPTSPCKILNILSLEIKSLLISLITLFWSLVNWNGIRFNDSLKRLFENFLLFFLIFFIDFLTSEKSNKEAKISSKANLL